MKKNISIVMFYWLNFITWLPLHCEILGNMCIAIICRPGYDIMNFEVKLIFLIKPFYLHDQNLVTKTKYLRYLRKINEIKNVFHHFQRAFNQANNTNFLEGESATFFFVVIFFKKNWLNVFYQSNLVKKNMSYFLKIWSFQILLL